MLTAHQDAIRPPRQPDGWSSAAAVMAASLLPSSGGPALIPSAGKSFRTTSSGRLAALEAPIPAVLRPVIRAYILGYASSVVPKLSALLAQHITRSLRRHNAGHIAKADNGRPPPPPLADEVRRILRFGLEWQRFPAFCAVLIGGSTLLEVPVRRLLKQYASKLSAVSRIRLSRWCASFMAGWLSLMLLQSKQTPGFTDTIVAKSDKPPGVQYKTIRYAGRTLDLTLFAVTRALDVIVGELWSRRRARRLAEKKWSKLEDVISRLTDPGVFATSCAFIMWTWFYLPAGLPRSYTKWITSAACVDARLIEALRRMRLGEMHYGFDTGQAPLLQGMCDDFGFPRAWGDPSVAVPFPCELVHMGAGPSCEVHALRRFVKAWRWSMATYLPLSLLLVARRRPTLRALARALLSAARSSAFLGTFITLFYYGVCLARTRVGPRLLGRDRDARTAIDGGLCVGTGCALAGWSVLLETAGRRKDMALFVAPKALGTLLPRRYGLDRRWVERLVFSASAAVVMTCMLENKKRVRGVLGGILGVVLEGS